jgi:hypothetical protein
MYFLKEIGSRVMSVHPSIQSSIIFMNLQTSGEEKIECEGHIAGNEPKYHFL